MKMIFAMSMGIDYVVDYLEIFSPIAKFLLCTF